MYIYSGHITVAYIMCPSARVAELPQGHCGDNWEGILFL